MIYNAFPSTTGEGEEGSINGTAEVPFKEIGLKGNTSQYSTTGKNLINCTSPTTTEVNLTVTRNEDGSYTLNGTSKSTTWYFRLCPNFTLPAGTYTLSNGNNEATGGYAVFYDDNNNFTTRTNIETKTFNDTVTIAPYIRVRENQIFNNFTIYPMIVAGSSAGEYEPYTNGPAPNPDYPYPVNVVTGDNEIKVVGKNLAKSTFDTKLRMTGSGANRTVSSANGNTSQIVKVKPNTTYTCSGDFSTLPNNYMRIGYFNSYPEVNSVSTNFVYNQSPFTFTTEASTNYIMLFNSNNVDTTISNLQLEKGNQATDYIPYQTYPINLGSMELCKIGDYQDYLYKENGIWYKYGAIGKLVLNGSENWWQDRELTNTYRYYTATILPNSIQNLAYCDNFKSVSTYTINNTDGEALCRINEGQIAIRLNKTRANTLNDFKSWLSTHNTTVYYILNTPTITEITDTTLIEQLDNLEKAYSYDTQTNISQTNQDKPFIISYEAILSLRNVLNS